MSIKTNELQQITAPQGSDSLLLDTAAAGTGRLALAQAAEFFGAELVKQTNSVGAALSQKADAGPPTWYNLPLNTSLFVDGGSLYTRNSNGLVTVVLRCRRIDSMELPSGSLIATLPAGYRPKKLQTSGQFFATWDPASAGGGVTYIGVDYAGGTHIFLSKVSNVTVLATSLSFYADT